MKIVIDGVIFQLQAGRPRGIYRLWNALIPALAKAMPNDEFILMARNGIAPKSECENLRVENVPAYDFREIYYTCPKADVNISTYYTVPQDFSRNIVWVYDMIPERFSWTGVEWSAKDRALMVSEPVALSKATARAYSERMRKGLVPVIYPGINNSFSPRCGESDGRPYFLMFGSDVLYKNTQNTLAAWKNSGAKEVYDLCVIGAQGNVSDGIIPVGNVSNAQLLELYQNATAFLDTSLVEGFGLPVTEAQRCKTLVIASSIPEFEESGGTHYIGITPTNVTDMTDAINAVAIAQEDQFASMINRAYKYSLSFSLARCVGNWVDHINGVKHE